ncbi:DUF6524 family protein [Roseococcus thiosulfatophilus]|uniref:DUF6524 family protein n=1 Tax=Roseococcus thiosulfatophilus TaxID=35813 RepID=UPI001A8F7754|nr:DUF6524 family protein [Roseococcus thiosulfatophilus]
MTRFLRNIPIWGWFLLILMNVYVLYNPSGLSVFHLWAAANEVALPVKLLVTAFALLGFGLYVYGAWRALGPIGLGIITLIIVLCIWAADFYGLMDARDASVWSWLIQPLLAIVLTLGFQWPKLWKAATGRVEVEDPDTPSA